MRLEHNEETTGEFVQGFQACRNLVGIMSEIVDDDNAYELTVDTTLENEGDESTITYTVTRSGDVIFFFFF